MGKNLEMKLTEECQQGRGWLKNGHPPGDFTTAPRCGAKTRKETACKAPAMKNGRCRMHGGKSTGPRTKEGLERSRRANWKHGFYSREAIDERRMVRDFIKESRGLLIQIKG